MDRRVAILALAIGIGGFGQPLLAQSEQPAPVADRSPIVVTGRAPGESAQDAARAFVREVSAAPVSGQFARWKAPVCVKVIGLSDEQNAQVAARIVAVAKEAKVRLGKPGCKTNLLIAFSPDANALTNEMAGLDSRRFSQLTPEERQLLTASQLPVRWWYNTRVEGVDGHRFGGESAMLLNAQVEGATGEATSPTGPGIASREDSVVVDGYNTSLVGTRVRALVEQATVVIDVKLTTGRTLDTVAVYAAMVTLARVKLGTQVADSGSILSLFTPGASPPNELSPTDRAYLAALYRIPANREARQQERAIAAQMVKLMAEDGAD